MVLHPTQWKTSVVDTISQLGFQVEVVTSGARRFPPLCRHLTLIGSDLDQKNRYAGSPSSATVTGSVVVLCPLLAQPPCGSHRHPSHGPRTRKSGTQKQLSCVAQHANHLGTDNPWHGANNCSAHIVRIRGMEFCLATLPGSGEFPSAHTRFVSTVCPASAQ